MKRRMAAVVWMSCVLAQQGLFANGESGAPVRPVTNPVFLDLADVGTSIHPIFMKQEFPAQLNTTSGPVPVGGDFHLYALQFEVKVSDRWSIIAVKDGYIDHNPDATLSDATGWGDVGGGAKWVFWKDEAREAVASARLVVEFPWGDDDVWQGNGDSTIDPAVTAMKQINAWQLLGTVGFIVPFDGDAESAFLYDAWHVSYNIKDRFFPLIELNHFYVIDEGAGPRQFTKQVDGAVPSVARFEGGDLVNLGARNAGDNPNLVTLGLGARARLTDEVDLGAAYEFPLTDEEDSLMDSRITADLVWRF